MIALDPTELAKDLAAQFATRAADADRSGKLPHEDIAALKQSGYLTLSVPREYGGQGGSLEACVAAQLELAQGSGATALVAGMHLHILGYASETRSWDEDTFARLCEATTRGALINSAASEPQLGSPSRGGLPQTTLRQDGDALVLNGHKNWVTGGRHLTHLLVRAALEGEAVTLIVPQDTPGIRWDETWGDALSLRASDSHDVTFEDVHLPGTNILRQTRQGGPNAWFPLTMAAVYLGVAHAARNAVIRYALERVPTALGKAIATLPKIQRQIGELDVALMAARTLLLDTARGWTGAQYPRVAAAKHLATETALSVTDQAMRIAGGASVGKELPLERLFRDVRAGLMHPPSGDTALEIVGRGALEG